MKTVRVVPLFPFSVLLATEISPPRASTSCLVTQRPMRIPRSTKAVSVLATANFPSGLAVASLLVGLRAPWSSQPPISGVDPSDESLLVCDLQ